jgi:hypothetical protein
MRDLETTLRIVHKRIGLTAMRSMPRTSGTTGATVPA